MRVNVSGSENVRLANTLYMLQPHVGFSDCDAASAASEVSIKKKRKSQNNPC